MKGGRLQQTALLPASPEEESKSSKEAAHQQQLQNQEPEKMEQVQEEGDEEDDKEQLEFQLSFTHGLAFKVAQEQVLGEGGLIELDILSTEHSSPKKKTPKARSTSRSSSPLTPKRHRSLVLEESKTGEHSFSMDKRDATEASPCRERKSPRAMRFSSPGKSSLFESDKKKPKGKLSMFENVDPLPSAPERETADCFQLKLTRSMAAAISSIVEEVREGQLLETSNMLEQNYSSVSKMRENGRQVIRTVVAGRDFGGEVVDALEIALWTVCTETGISLPGTKHFKDVYAQCVSTCAELLQNDSIFGQVVTGDLSSVRLVAAISIQAMQSHGLLADSEAEQNWESVVSLCSSDLGQVAL